ncbi:hypothetical protein [Marinitoga lauensis]|uniref:hypothetical protein n=1 Tax=Marinitoga lauensis TaxID=2201189 RepID=UPI001F10D47F|nr:hypothetical protein [Marinitoga lauensis]
MTDIEKSAYNKFELWIKKADSSLKYELITIKNNKEELLDRFFKDLEFGTGGLRGKIGAGTNRMNIHTVARATQDLLIT